MSPVHEIVLLSVGNEIEQRRRSPPGIHEFISLSSCLAKRGSSLDLRTIGLYASQSERIGHLLFFLRLLDWSRRRCLFDDLIESGLDK